MTTNNELISELRYLSNYLKYQVYMAETVNKAADTIEPQAKQIDHLQDIASFIGVGGNNGATVDQLLERVKNEFLRLSNLGRAQAKQIEALQADAEHRLDLLQEVSRCYTREDDLPVDTKLYTAPVAPAQPLTKEQDADVEYWRKKYQALDKLYDELEKEKEAIEQNYRAIT